MKKIITSTLTLTLLTVNAMAYDSTKAKELVGLAIANDPKNAPVN
ncbi:MAG: hypothetical protein U9O64_02665 [Campylobacterota bacterium]|nr:hypothetical protein [Campylobacterota bacterium]